MVLFKSFRPTTTNLDQQDIELVGYKKGDKKKQEEVMNINDSL